MLHRMCVLLRTASVAYLITLVYHALWLGARGQWVNLGALLPAGMVVVGVLFWLAGSVAHGKHLRATVWVLGFLLVTSAGSIPVLFIVPASTTRTLVIMWTVLWGLFLVICIVMLSRAMRWGKPTA